MVGVDADFVLLGVEGEFAVVDRLQLMVGPQVRPAPQATVDDVRKTFSVGDLEASI